MTETSETVELYPDLDLRARVYLKTQRVHFSGEWDQPFDGTEKPREFFSADFNLSTAEKALPFLDVMAPAVAAKIRAALDFLKNGAA